MANNHMGDVNHGLQIIELYSKFITQFPQFTFAFKFQMRDLNTFIHKNYFERNDLKYIKRFKQTALTLEQFNILKEKAKSLGFLTICTPFDQKSVQNVIKLKFDILKIASCSFTDWPLLNQIVKYDIPIIASTGGSTLQQIDNVVSFFKHRNKEFAIMHCIGEYPVLLQHLNLNQIDIFRKRYNIQVGFSSHENPKYMQGIKCAIAKGANIFQRHVALVTSTTPKNEYSSQYQDIKLWLQSARQTFLICGQQNKREYFSEKQLKDLKQLKRGVFLKGDVIKGQIIGRDNVYYAFPSCQNQILANDMSKYVKYKINNNIAKDSPLMSLQSEKIDKKEKILNIVKTVKNIIQKSGIIIPQEIELQISHHYGIDNFFQYGLTMFTIVNEDYCKKYLILLPNQSHPQQYHNKKQQTFFIIYGTAQIFLDGKLINANKGDIVTVLPKVKHMIKTSTGCIIQEISSIHFKDDSFYTSEVNKDRKTIVKYWKDIYEY